MTAVLIRSRATGPSSERSAGMQHPERRDHFGFRGARCREDCTSSNPAQYAATMRAEPLRWRRLHPRRTARGHCDHRAAGGDAVAIPDKRLNKVYGVVCLSNQRQIALRYQMQREGQSRLLNQPEMEAFIGRETGCPDLWCRSAPPRHSGWTPLRDAGYDAASRRAVRGGTVRAAWTWDGWDWPKENPGPPSRAGSYTWNG